MIQYLSAKANTYHRGGIQPATKDMRVLKIVDIVVSVVIVVIADILCWTLILSSEYIRTNVAHMKTVHDCNDLKASGLLLRKYVIMLSHRNPLHISQLTVSGLLMSLLPSSSATWLSSFSSWFLTLGTFLLSELFSVSVSSIILHSLTRWYKSFPEINKQPHSRCCCSSEILPCQVHPFLASMHLTKIFSYTRRAIRFIPSSSVSLVLANPRPYGQQSLPPARASRIFSVTHARLELI